MQLSDLLEAYLEIKRGEGLRKQTLTMYRQHISRFIDSLPASRLTINKVAVADVARFISSEEERGMSINTRRARHRALDIWFNWISDQESAGKPTNLLRRADGRLRLKPPRKGKHKPRRADLDQIRHIANQIPMSDWIGLRDRAMLLLALDSGARIGEICALNVEDVNIAERTIHIHHGKGDKERMVPFTASTATALALYLMSRPNVSPNASYCNRLFLASFVAMTIGVRGALTVSGASQRLDQLCQAANIQRVNWHSIRHLFGTKAINDGLRAETVSLLMGHSDVDFTRRIYAELLPSTARAEYDRTWKT